MLPDLVKRVYERVGDVVDEETNRKLVELNIVTDVSQPSEGFIVIKFRPLSPFSPLAVETGRAIRNAALSVEGVKKVRVECFGHMQDDLVNRLVNKERQ
jgi:metal-sulfur cluster biosynthetic enzyme